MKRLIKIATALLMAALSIINANAQNSQTEAPSAFSPNAADLGRYGKVPVNYFNGLAGVTVPLTEVNGKGINVPVYLSYHAGGTRTDEHPGWVGLGWSLQAGGCINRIVKGMRDEMAILEAIEFGITCNNTNPGNLYHAPETQSKDWTEWSELGQLDSNHNIRDYEPDEFQVCLEGINASFYIVGNSEVEIVSQSDVDFKVEWTLRNPGTSTQELFYPIGMGTPHYNTVKYTYISGFVITNKDGVKYTFGGDDSAIEFSTVMLNGYLFSSANTWHLTSIETPYGETVSFNYEKDGTPIVKYDSRYWWSYTDLRFGAETETVNSESVFGNDVRKSLSFVLIRPSYLSSIECGLSGDSLEFKRDTTFEARYDYERNELAKRFWGLDDISITSFDNQKNEDYYCQLSGIKHGNLVIDFTYTSSDMSRLKLLKVAFNDSTSTGNKIMEYSMEYNEDIAFPGYHAKMNDIWGYYNGIDYSTASYMDLNSIRIPHAQRMKLDILTKVTYPTGGYTTFEYEPHTYSKVMRQFPFSVAEINSPVDSIAGGVRIYRITDVPLVGEPVVRTFSYNGSNGRSSGILSGKPVYQRNGHTYVTIFYEEEEDSNWNIDYMEYSGSYIMSQEDYFNQLSTTNGNQVTYSTVKESVNGNGWTVYNYTNHDDEQSMDRCPTVMYDNFEGSLLSNPFNSRSLFRGLLKSKSVYSEDGTLLMSGQYTYNVDTTRIVKSAALTTACREWVKKLSYVKIPCAYPALTSSVELTFPQGGGAPIVSSGTYTYDYGSRQILSETRNVGGDNGMTETVAYTYPNHMSAAWNPVFSGMVNRHIISEPVQTTVKRNGKVYSSTLTTWKETPDGLDVLYVPDKIYIAATDDGTTNISTYCGTTGTFSDRFTSGYVTSFDKYDEYGNPTVTTDKDGVQTARVWEKGRNNPSAVFRNAGTVPVTHAEEYETSQSTSFPIYSGVPNSRTFTFKNLSNSPVTVSFIPADGTTEWFVNMTVDNLYSFPVGRVLSNMSSLSAHYGVQSTASVIIPPGNHTMTLQTVACSQSSTGYMAAIAISYPNVATRTVYVQENSFFFNGFEDDNQSSSPGYYSGRSHTGNYTISLTLDTDRSYSIDYMVHSGSGWTYKKYPFTGSYHISESGPIDNVRVYPDGCEVTSYTWDDHGNLLSATDGRGITTSYSYDVMDRLLSISDNNGDPVCSYDYSHTTSGNAISVSGNHVKSRQYTSTGGSSFNDTFAYYDGLGRKVQTVLKKASPQNSNSDIVDWTDYDSAGRESRSWLPACKSGNNGAFAGRSANSGAWTATYSSSETRPFTETIYEASPAERTVEVYGPGEEWFSEGRSSKVSLLGNLSQRDSLRCRLFTASVNGTTSPSLDLRSTGLYPDNTLSVSVTSDEDGRTGLEFKDMYGQTVLTRVKETGSAGTVTYYDTYYVYDAIGRLTAVIPPALAATLDSNGSWSESTQSVADYAYIYKYDSRGNIIARKLPGCGWDYYAYDRGGRLVMSQDPVQRNSGLSSFLLQDKIGRPAVSGESSTSPDYMNEPFRNVDVYAFIPQNASYDGQYKGYSVSGMTPGSPVLHTVNYYDDYDFLAGSGFPSSQSSSVAFDSTAGSSYASHYTLSDSGLLTGSLETVLSSSASQYLWHIFYYDDKGRVAQERSSVHTGGVNKYWYGYDFTGNVTKNRHSYVPSSGASVTELYTFSFDNWGRPVQTTLAIGNDAPETIESNTYDAIGRLSTTGRSGNSSLMSSYVYNVRSWMSSVSGSLFTETLCYQDGTSPQWSGNISSMLWKAGSESGDRRYDFTYDGLSRLKSADYSEPSVTGAFSETYSYDRNSNLTALSRYGLNSAGTARTRLLNLTLSNTGNRLSSVGSSSVGYDSKGRQTSYNYGGASTMSYNAIDLPQIFTKGSTIVEWKYSASGVKLQKKTTTQ